MRCFSGTPRFKTGCSCLEAVERSKTADTGGVLPAKVRSSYQRGIAVAMEDFRIGASHEGHEGAAAVIRNPNLDLIRDLPGRSRSGDYDYEGEVPL